MSLNNIFNVVPSEGNLNAKTQRIIELTGKLENSITDIVKECSEEGWTPNLFDINECLCYVMLNQVSYNFGKMPEDEGIAAVADEIAKSSLERCGDNADPETLLNEISGHLLHLCRTFHSN